MDYIEDFFLRFGQFSKDADVLWTVLMPIFSLILIGILCFCGLKIFSKKDRLRMVFKIHRTLVIASLFFAFFLITFLCSHWSKNILREERFEFGLLLSLLVSYIVPIVSLFVLRNYWEKANVNEIVSQPISAEQARNNIPYINKAFNKIRLWFFFPLIGFFILLFSLNNEKNLISLVYDNSGSMETTNSYRALETTFGKLDKNNEIIITTLNGSSSISHESVKEIMLVKSSSNLKAGKIYAFKNPNEAKSAFNALFMSDDVVHGSPIYESIWKMWLFTKELKGNAKYKNKLLIVITDGDDNYVKSVDNFFFNDVDYSEYYTPDNTYIVDYSEDGNGSMIKKFEENGVKIYPAVTSFDDYIFALDETLFSFQNDSFLLALTIVISALATFIGLAITHKKIII